jgi:hypothetical protein
MRQILCDVCGGVIDGPHYLLWLESDRATTRGMPACSPADLCEACARDVGNRLRMRPLGIPDPSPAKRGG